MPELTQEFIELKPVQADKVNRPAVGNKNLFLDIADNQIKTKDIDDVVAVITGGGGGGAVSLINNLVQTTGGSALDARQGKALNDLIVALKAGSNETIASLKSALDTLNTLVTGTTPDGDALVNTIQELLTIFATYPEGATIANALSGKQSTLVSGVNIKTAGGVSLLGSGDIPLPAPTTSATDLTSGTLPDARLANVGTPATAVGSATTVPIITTDSKGRVTAVSSVAIAGGGGSATTDASQLTTGTLPDARLSAAIARTADVVNTLTETTAGKILDARQGKVLNDLIVALKGGSTETIASLKTSLNTLNTLVTGTTPDGDALVNTIQELLTIFATYPEGVTIANALASKLDTNTYNTNRAADLAAAQSAANITQDATHRFATDAEKLAWNAKANGINPVFKTLAYAATTVYVNDNTQPNAEVTLTGNTTISLTGSNSGDSGVLKITKTAGTETVSFPGIVKGTLATTAGAVDLISWLNDGGTIRWFVEGGSSATGAQSVEIQTFNTVGTFTWNKPAGAKFINVLLIAGGGGGGGGRKGAAGTIRSGGGGGGSGGYSEGNFTTAQIGATMDVVVGAAGIGGINLTTNNQNGINGTSGGFSAFGSVLRATGGLFGTGGDADGAPGGAAGLGSRSNGAQGSASSATGATGTTGLASTYASGAGASGGGITSADVPSVGGNGSLTPSLFNYSISAVSATGIGGNGVAPTNLALIDLFANGPSGGGSSTTGNGGGGAAGGSYGGGGAGGGAATNDVGNAGNGGDGAQGYVRITIYF